MAKVILNRMIASLALRSEGITFSNLFLQNKSSLLVDFSARRLNFCLQSVYHKLLFRFAKSSGASTFCANDDSYPTMLMLRGDTLHAYDNFPCKSSLLRNVRSASVTGRMRLEHGCEVFAYGHQL